MGFGFGLDCQTQKERPFDSSVSAQDFFFKYWSSFLILYSRDAKDFYFLFLYVEHELQ